MTQTRGAGVIAYGKERLRVRRDHRFCGKLRKMWWLKEKERMGVVLEFIDFPSRVL
jgi:hypothetical protein